MSRGKKRLLQAVPSPASSEGNNSRGETEPHIAVACKVPSSLCESGRVVEDSTAPVGELPANLDGYTGASASGVGPMIGCPPRMALPQSRTTGEYAIRGNIIHNFCRLIGYNPDNREAALAEIEDTKIRDTCRGIDLAEVFAGIDIVAFERAYILNVKDRTVRLAGDNIERQYNKALVSKGLEPLGKYDVPATIDFVGMDKGIPVETDYKSGQSIGDPEIHWQRRICAIALMIHYGTATAKSRVAYVKEDGQILLDGCEFSCMDIDDFCDEVVAAIDAVVAAKAMLAARQMPTVNPSDDNCKYCNALTSCPYYTNLAKSMSGDLEAVEQGPDLRTLTPEAMGVLWDKMKKYKTILENIEVVGKLIATTTPLVVDEHFEIRPSYQAGRMNFDDSAARGEIAKLMYANGSTEEQVAAKIKSLSKQGKSFAKFLKVKRALPVVEKEEF